MNRKQPAATLLSLTLLILTIGSMTRSHASVLSNDGLRVTSWGSVEQQEPVEGDKKIKVTVIRSLVSETIKLLVTFPSEADPIKITMHNLLGRQILQLPERNAVRGEETYQIDTRDLPNGHYFIVIEALGQRITKKVILSR